MTMFGYFITRDLTDEERSELQGKIAAISADYAQRPAAETPAPAMAVGISPTALIGWRQMGDQSTYWSSNGPVMTRNSANEADTASIPPELWAAIQATFPAAAWENAVNIAFRESRYRLDARKYDDVEHSFGVFQVNSNAWPQYDEAALSTYAEQVAAAWEIFKAQGWGAWANSAQALGIKS